MAIPGADHAVQTASPRVPPDGGDVMFDPRAPWEQRLDRIVDAIREMSLQTDPQAMVASYAARMRGAIDYDRMVALSRRDLEPPRYRITRSSMWKTPVNPWQHKDRLPLLDHGLLGELLYEGRPRLIDDFRPDPGDPALEYLEGMRSLVALPHFDNGVATNMAIFMRAVPGGYAKDRFPDMALSSALFGRATQNLVLSSELKRAYDAVDRELQVVADIQRSLLPAQLPSIRGLDLAAHYRTARRAGGDYYDFFPLRDGKWGILIADVSGHGTPAAVVMAITHSLAHADPDMPSPPSHLLHHLNAKLSTHYTIGAGAFVTAFYGVYDPATRVVTYACAGHNPPRVVRCATGEIFVLDCVQRLPLGIVPDEGYTEASFTLQPDDTLVLYTDGVTESRGRGGGMYGVERLDRVLNVCGGTAQSWIELLLEDIEEFTGRAPPEDDRTLVAIKVV